MAGPQLGVGEDDPVDVAVRLEVNHWNGAVEPQVVLRELYRRDGGGARRSRPRPEWWQRFEAELARDPSRSLPELEPAAWADRELVERRGVCRQRQSAPGRR